MAKLKPDPNAKEDPLAFQEDFLKECAEAAAAGFPPNDEDPVYEDGAIQNDEDD